MGSSGTQGVASNGAASGTGDHAAVDGRMPVTEFLFDRPGAASPFGDDLVFPLPMSAVAYRHPDTEH